MIAMKVSILDKRVFAIFLEVTAYISAVASMIFIFVEIPSDKKIIFGIAFVVLLLIAYLIIWIRSNRLNEVSLKVDGSTVVIKAGDIFNQPGFKAIAFNEYFDTIVDNKLISDESLNGIFIRSHVPAGVADLDQHIENYNFEPDEIITANAGRAGGKQVKYKIGTICVYGDYLLAAFAKFDEQNMAHLTMPEYLGFLIVFWDKVNKVYAQKSVSTPIFGSGITRIKEHKNITDEDLLKIMLWTFRISEMRFKHPAKLTIVIHKDKINQVNLLDISSARNGL